MSELLTANDVHIDHELSDIAVANVQKLEGRTIADKVFPRVSVSQKSNKFYVWDPASFTRTSEVELRAENTEARQVGMALSTDNYTTEQRSLAMRFSEQALANADAALTLEEAGIMRLQSTMMLQREQKWFTDFMSTGVWGADYAGVASNPTGTQFLRWNDANSNPKTDIEGWKRAMNIASGGVTGMATSFIGVMGYDVFDTLMNNASVLAVISGGATIDNPGIATKELLQRWLGLDELYVSDLVTNTAAEGLAAVNTAMLTNKFGLFTKADTPGIMTPAAGYTFVWDNPTLSSRGYGVEVLSYDQGDLPNLKLTQTAKHLEVNTYYDHKVIGASLGALATAVIA